jgi:hypothetical protein
MTNWFRIDDKFFIVQNKCSKIPPSTLMHCATRLRILRFFHLYFCEQQHPKFVLCIHLSIVNSVLHPTPETNLKELGVEIQIFLSRRTLRIRHIFLRNVFHSGRYYHLSKYWPLLLNHPVYASINNSGPIARFWLITSENIIKQKMCFGHKMCFAFLFILFTKQFSTLQVCI